MHEDEGIYYDLSLHGHLDFQSGVLWRIFGKSLHALNWIPSLKLAPTLLGLLISWLLLMSAEGLESILFAFLFGISPIFFSQAHRFRPEILHTSLAFLSFFFLAAAYAQESNRTRFTRLYALGLLFALSIVQTHIMSFLHLPGIFLLIAFLTFRNFKKPKTVILGYLIIFSVFFLCFQPALLTNGFSYLHSISGSQIPNARVGIFGPFTIIFDNATVWFSDVATWRPFFSRGHHLRVLIQLMLCLFLIKMFEEIWQVSRSGLSMNSVLGLCSGVNVAAFISSIYLFKRINNSYLLILDLWLFAFFVFGAKAKARSWSYSTFVGVVILGFFAIESLHFAGLVFPYRNSLFTENLIAIEAGSRAVDCNKLDFASAPYFPFFSAQDAADLSKTDGDVDQLKVLLAGLPTNSCIFIHARHLWGFEFFSQYHLAKLRDSINRNFKSVSTIELPYYKHERSLFIKERDGKSLPIGSDYLYYDGHEVGFFFKRTVDKWQ